MKKRTRHFSAFSYLPKAARNHPCNGGHVFRAGLIKITRQVALAILALSLSLTPLTAKERCSMVPIDVTATPSPTSGPSVQLRPKPFNCSANVGSW